MALTLVVLLASAATARAAADIPALVRKLGSKESAVCYQAYRELSRLRHLSAIPLLVEALPGYPQLGQQYGFYVLQGYPIEACRKPLHRLLKCDSPYLVVAAAAHLHRTGKEDRGGEIVGALRKPVTDQVLMAMVQRLYSLKSPPVLAELRGMLCPPRSPMVVRAVLYCLHQAKDPEATAQVATLLSDPKLPAEVRLFFLAFLYGRGDVGRAKALAAALTGAKTAQVNFYQLTNYLEGLSELGEPVKKALLALLAEDTGVSVLTGVLGLFKSHPWRRAIPVLRKLLDHKTESVAKAAFAALVACPGGLSTGRLRVLLGHKDLKRRIQAADTLRRLDDMTGLAAVLALAKKPGPARADAVEAVGRFRSHACVPVLLDALLAPQNLVRQRAWSALRTLLPALFTYRHINLETLGYRPHATPAASRVAVGKLRAWYTQAMQRSW